MDSDLQTKVLNALRFSLRPLARLLLRHGITYGQFIEVTKTAFVEEALVERDQRGRATNKSRIAIRTGLSRKEVTRVRERIQQSAGKNGSARLLLKIGSAARVLQLWHVDERFLDGDGQPKGLVFSGEDDSFSSLVKLAGGDIPPGALRAELMETKSVTELPSGELLPLRRHFIPTEVGQELLVGLTHIVVPVMEGLAHNTSAAKHDPFFQRFAYSDRLTAAATALFRERVSEQSEAFLHSVDDWLSSNESGGQGADDLTRRVGIGIFYYESEAPRPHEPPGEE